MRLWPLAVFSSATFVTLPANATYSVLLYNAETGELGGAAVSCVGDFDLALIFGYAKYQSRAVGFFTQALYSEFNHARVLAWLNEGRAVSDVLAEITTSNFDTYATERQYHFLPNDGAGVTWTGADTLPRASGRTGSYGPWRYTLAGNILTSEHVLALAEQSLQTANGPLEERLIATLEAGATNGEGDARCSPLPGDSAFLEVRNAAGLTRLHHSVIDTRPNDPLVTLRAAVLPKNASSDTSDAENAPSTSAPWTDPLSTEVPSGASAPPPPEPAPVEAAPTRRAASCELARVGRDHNRQLLAWLVATALGLRIRLMARLNKTLRSSNS